MKHFRFEKRIHSFLIIAAIYIIAFMAGMLVFYASNSLHILLSVLFANITATLIVWLSGILFSNSSVYDPYWSVAPIVIIIFFIFTNRPFSFTGLLVLAAVAIWGIRLTLNWAIRWNGLSHQDWRYTMLKNNSSKFWFFTNLFGINLMPTIIVFIALVPAYYITALKNPANFLTITGFILCIIAVAIQATADIQMDIFKKSQYSIKKSIDRGLWRYSRHPNYFGEILFWWGIWAMLLSLDSSMWFTIAGPVVMTLLFIFISIPMMEKYNISKRNDYNNYRQYVSALIPWFRKSGF